MPTLPESAWDALLSAAHVWHVDPEHPPAGMLAQRPMAWLTADEIARHEQLRTDRLRDTYLTTRALCRAVLSRYAAIDPAGWRFATGPHGKPTIARPVKFKSLRFNLTHTEGLVACVVSRAGKVGIDAEQTSRAVDVAQVARHFLSAADQKQLAELPSERRTAWFFVQWVLKEAYLKGRGTGLSHGLDRFTIEWDSAGNPLPLGSWQLTLHSPTTRHLAAVAVRRPRAGGPIAIHWFNGWPEK